jgi:hypothetical protein
LPWKYEGDTLAHVLLRAIGESRGETGWLNTLFETRLASRLLAAALANRQHLAPTIRAAIRADVVRAVRLAALRADGQLGNLHLMVHAPVALAMVREAFLW